MAKAKKASSDFAGFHFHDPRIQAAYEQMFSSPVVAPVIVQYDGSETAAQKEDRAIKMRVLAGQMSQANAALAANKKATKDSQRGINRANKDLANAAKNAPNSILGQAGIKEGYTKGTGVPMGTGGDANMAKRIAAQNIRIMQAGGKPVTQAHKGQSLWGRTLDILSRGNYMVANATLQGEKANVKGAGVLGTLGAMAGGAWKGIEGKQKSHFSDVAQFTADALHAAHAGKNPNQIRKGEGKVNKWVKASMLAPDIFLDPSTYAGIGLVGDTAKAAEKSAALIEHLGQAEKAGVKISEADRHLLSGADRLKRHGAMSKEAQTAQVSQILDPVQQIAAGVKNKRYAEIRKSQFDNGLVEAATTGARTKKEAKAAQAALIKDAREQATNDGLLWQQQAIKGYQDMAATEIKKGLGIKLGTRVDSTVVALPLGRLPVAATEKIKNIDVVSKGLASYEKYFKNSAGIMPELKNKELTATSRAAGRAHEIGQGWRVASHGTHTEDRIMATDLALSGSHDSGVMFHDPATGQAVDAAQYMDTRVRTLTDRVLHGATGDTIPYTAGELNQHLPKEMHFNDSKKMGEDWLRESMKNWGVKDGPTAIFMAEQAFERAASNRALLQSIRDSFAITKEGNGAIKGMGHTIRQMEEKHGYREIKSSLHRGLLNGAIFDPETAKGVEKILESMQPQEWPKFMKGLAEATNPIKFALTMVNPGFHMRNAIGDYFINMLDNVSAKSYKQSAMLQRHEAERYGGINPMIMQQGDILENANRRSQQTVLFHTAKPLKRANGTSRTAVTEAEIYAGIHKYGISQNFAASDFGPMAGINAEGGAGKTFLSRNERIQNARAKLVSASNIRENHFRNAHFIDLVKKNPSNARTLDENMAYAAARVRDRHFDYTDFTKFEKQTMSTVLPFYKWTRKALPLMTEIMFTQPGKAIIPNKAQRSISQLLGQNPDSNDPIPNLNGLIPKWMIDAGYSPGAPMNFLGHHNQTMFDLPSPFSDTFAQTIQPASEGKGSGIINVAGQMLNPLLKMPIEQALNRDFFLSDSSHSVPVRQPDTGQPDAQSTKEQLLRYGAKQVPYVRQIMKGFEGPQDKRNFGALISQLSGIYTQELTPSMQRGEQSRQLKTGGVRARVLKRDITKQLKAAGQVPPTTNKQWEIFLADYARTHGNP